MQAELIWYGDNSTLLLLELDRDNEESARDLCGDESLRRIGDKLSAELENKIDSCFKTGDLGDAIVRSSGGTTNLSAEDGNDSQVS